MSVIGKDSSTEEVLLAPIGETRAVEKAVNTDGGAVGPIKAGAFAIVPTECTEEMVEAHREECAGDADEAGPERIRGAWRAMLSAAAMSKPGAGMEFWEARRAGGRVKLVIVESPYAGEIEVNVEYARRCIRDSLARGEAPIASHLLYTQPGVLRDELPDERQWGIDAGLAWGRVADLTAVYTDRGISRGMQYGIAAAEAVGRPIEIRTLTPSSASEIAAKKVGTVLTDAPGDEVQQREAQHIKGGE